MCKESEEDTAQIFPHRIASLLLNIAWFAMKTAEETVICRRIQKMSKSMFWLI